MFQSYYRINVSLNGYYLFATEQGKITDRQKAREIINLFKEKFPESEGYNVTCVYWDSKGTEIK